MSIEQQGLYVVIGSIMIIVNAPIVITVLKYKVLRQRKEYIIFAGLAFSDLLAGVATTEAGVYRLLVDTKANMRRSECALIPHTWLFLFASPAQAISIFMVSLDRLIAMLVPVKYFVFGPAYSLTMVLIGYSMSASLTFLAIFRLMSNSDANDSVNVYCVAFVIIDNRSFRWLFYTRLFFAISGVLTYILVLIIYAWHSRKTCRDTSSSGNLFSSAQYRRRQRNLNKTVGFTCTFTTLLYIIPIILNMGVKTFASDKWYSPSAAVYVWMCHCLNSLINAATYTLRHADMKDSLLYCLCCRDMPTNFVDQNRNVRISRRPMSLSHPQFRYDLSSVRPSERRLRSMIEVSQSSPPMISKKLAAFRTLSFECGAKRRLSATSGSDPPPNSPRTDSAQRRRQHRKKLSHPTIIREEPRIDGNMVSDGITFGATSRSMISLAVIHQNSAGHDTSNGSCSLRKPLLPLLFTRSRTAPICGTSATTPTKTTTATKTATIRTLFFATKTSMFTKSKMPERSLTSLGSELDLNAVGCRLKSTVLIRHQSLPLPLQQATVDRNGSTAGIYIMIDQSPDD